MSDAPAKALASVPRERLALRWGELKNERASWMAHWQEISNHLLPRSGRFFMSDRNRGERRHNAIYDNTGTRALRTLAAGMMSGMTSPARPWFRLRTADTDLMQYAPVKYWMQQCTDLMLEIFQKSNTYRALHAIYEELGAFGTASSIVVPSFETVIHHHPLTVGEYAIATDWSGVVVTLYREFQKTVGELVNEFGYRACSNTVQSLYTRGQLGAWVTVIHAIEPRSDRDQGKRDNLNMPWRSIYYEEGQDKDRCLRESGYQQFPALCPRWAVAGGDIYGNSPGMEVLGDVKQLQQEQLRKSLAIDYQTKPPLQVPLSMKNREVEMLPGGISFVDMTGPASTIRTAFDVSLNLSYLLADIQDIRERIRGGFYADLFLMLANQADARMTATEVAERHEEKLLMLGPVLERLQNELLDPLINMTFARIMAAGILPRPPRELQGRALDIELMSMLAQAQRAIGTNSIDRFVGAMGGVAQAKPDVLDNFDADKWAEIYSDALGIDPRILVPADQVKALRQARAQQAQQAQQAALINQGADTAQKLAGARTDQPNALTDVTRAFSGYS